jgi:hypothetical protein
MGQYGGIYFYTEHLHPSPSDLLRSAIEVLAPIDVEHIMRSHEQNEWDAFLEESESEDDPPRMSYESLPKTSVVEVVNNYQPGNVLSVTFKYPSPVALRVYEDNLTLPESVRGDFNTWDLGMTLGWHDLFSTADDPQPRLFGRAFFSVRIGGQGSPGDWEEYRRRVWALPAIAEMRAKLEPLMQPMKTCEFWAV